MRFRMLLWGTVVLASLAAGAVVLDWFDRVREGPDLIGRTLIGRANLAAAGIVLIETPAGQVTMRRTPLGWSVDEQDGFAADTDKIRALLLRMARTPIAQRVPVRPDRLGELGLLQKVENQWRFEAGRTASVLSVIHGLEYRHRLIYQVLIGNPRRDGVGTYVRFPVSNSAYLVDEKLELDGRADSWIERRVFAPDAAAGMQQIRIRRLDAPPLTFVRAAAGQPWRLAGQAPAPDAARVQELAEALAALRIVGVSARRSQAVAMPRDSPRVEVHFFDRHVVTLLLRSDALETGRPAVLSARLSGDPADDAVRWEVEAFNWRFGSRVVGLDAAQSSRLLERRERYGAH